MKAILLSVQPKWVEKILNKEKTIEIRKTAPRCKLPIDVYIYCTKRNGEIWSEPKSDDGINVYGFPLNLIERLSDKPQISEEDFEELLKTLTLFCKTTWLGKVFDDDIKKENIKLYLEKYLRPQPPRTQGDKIRAMSNEELTKEIYKFFIQYEWCALNGKEYIRFNEKGFLEFLNSEVKEDE